MPLGAIRKKGCLSRDWSRHVNNSVSTKSAAPLVGTPKADWLARNFVWWSRWEGGSKGLAGACFLWWRGGQRAGWRMFFVVRVRVTIRVKARVGDRIWNKIERNIRTFPPRPSLSLSPSPSLALSPFAVSLSLSLSLHPGMSIEILYYSRIHQECVFVQ